MENPTQRQAGVAGCGLGWIRTHNHRRSPVGGQGCGTGGRTVVDSSGKCRMRTTALNAHPPCAEDTGRAGAQAPGVRVLCRNPYSRSQRTPCPAPPPAQSRRREVGGREGRHPPRDRVVVEVTAPNSGGRLPFFFHTQVATPSPTRVKRPSPDLIFERCARCTLLRGRSSVLKDSRAALAPRAAERRGGGRPLLADARRLGERHPHAREAGGAAARHAGGARLVRTPAEGRATSTPSYSRRRWHSSSRTCSRERAS